MFKNVIVSLIVALATFGQGCDSPEMESPLLTLARTGDHAYTIHGGGRELHFSTDSDGSQLRLHRGIIDGELILDCETRQCDQLQFLALDGTDKGEFIGGPFGNEDRGKIEILFDGEKIDIPLGTERYFEPGLIALRSMSVLFHDTGVPLQALDLRYTPTSDGYLFESTQLSLTEHEVRSAFDHLLRGPAEMIAVLQDGAVAFSAYDFCDSTPFVLIPAPGDSGMIRGALGHAESVELTNGYAGRWGATVGDCHATLWHSQPGAVGSYPKATLRESRHRVRLH